MWVNAKSSHLKAEYRFVGLRVKPVWSKQRGSVNNARGALVPCRRDFANVAPGVLRRARAKWLGFRRDNAGRIPTPEEAPRIFHKDTTMVTVRYRMVEQLRKAGVDGCDSYTTHSMRRGGSTQADSDGFSEQERKLQGD